MDDAGGVALGGREVRHLVERAPATRGCRGRRGRRSSGTWPRRAPLPPVVKLPFTKWTTGVAGVRRSTRNLTTRPLATRSPAGVDSAANDSTESMLRWSSGSAPARAAGGDGRAARRCLGRWRPPRSDVSRHGPSLGRFANFPAGANMRGAGAEVRGSARDRTVGRGGAGGIAGGQAPAATRRSTSRTWPGRWARPYSGCLADDDLEQLLVLGRVLPRQGDVERPFEPPQPVETAVDDLLVLVALRPRPRRRGEPGAGVEDAAVAQAVAVGVGEPGGEELGDRARAGRRRRGPSAWGRAPTGTARRSARRTRPPPPTSRRTACRRRR